MTLRQASERWSPMAVRFLIVSSHYRSPLDFTPEAMDAASRGLERLWGAVRSVRERLQTAPEGPADDDVLATLEDHKARFLGAMDDDFNTSAAMGVLFELVRVSNALVSSPEPVTRETLAAIDAVYRELGGDILGLVPAELPTEGLAGLAAELVQVLIDTRQELRQAKQFALADQIRKRLRDLGIVLEDTPHGTRWVKA
jgi:cysteinyl-tRNA synthetase